MGPGALDLPSVVHSIEDLLHPSLSRLEARLSSVRIVVSRIAEADALGWWASSVWTRGHILYAPIFRSSWPKQRMLLALAAAAAAASDGAAASSARSLFALDARLDARIAHKLLLLDTSVYAAIGQHIDSMPIAAISDLASLANLKPPEDDEYGPQVGTVSATIAALAAADILDAT